MCFEQCGRELRHLALDLRTGHQQRGATDCLRSTAEGADTLFHHSGVAMQNRDMFEWDTELIRKNLRECCLVPLSVRRRSGCRADAAVTLDRHLRMLPATRRKRCRRS